MFLNAFGKESAEERSKSYMKACAVIPAFNEGKNIKHVINGVIDRGIDAIVVDDGSQDNTLSEAKVTRAHVIHHGLRCGKGLSLKKGFDYAINNSYDIIISMDADGQHDPSDIPVFLDKIKKEPDCVVLGNRMNAPKGMPIARVLTNKFMSSVISAICRQNIPDTQCGYRLFTKDALSKVAIKARKFEVESEILVKLARSGFKINSVPIKSIYGKEKSSIRPVRDTFRFLRFLTRIMFEN